MLKALIDVHDVPYRERWDELDADWREKMKGGIVAFELAVTRLDVKFKLSQNRSEADRSGVLRAMQQRRCRCARTRGVDAAADAGRLTAARRSPRS